MLIYESFGPHCIPRKRSGNGELVLDFSPQAITSFWTNVEEARAKLSTAIGCYIFAVRAPRSTIPWYIGQSKTGFRSECFQPQKQIHYYAVMNEMKTGIPLLFFVAKLSNPRPELRFASSLPAEEANFVERQLISIALLTNSNLRNVKGTKYPRNVKIPGILNSPSGRRSNGAKLLRDMFGLENLV